MKVYIDGKFYDEDKAKVSVFDHGLLYGDGIFEGIRAYHGRVFKLKEHIDRLYDSAKAILLTIPMTPAEMTRAVVETCRKNKVSDGYIRLVVTRGVGTLGLNPNRCKRPSVIIIAGKIQLYPPELYARGMDIVTVATTRNLHNAINPAIKSLNYLNNILAIIIGSTGTVVISFAGLAFCFSFLLAIIDLFVVVIALFVASLLLFRTHLSVHFIDFAFALFLTLLHIFISIIVFIILHFFLQELVVFEIKS